MKSLVKFGFVALASVTLMACESTQVKSTNPLSSSAQGDVKGFSSFGIVAADIHFAVRETANEFLKSPLSIKPDGTRWITQYSEIYNDTVIDLDTRILTSKLRKELHDSNRFIFTAATGMDKSNAVADARELQNSALFDQSTTAVNGTVTAPEISISGSIRQQISVSSDAAEQESAYYFEFSATDLASGLILFTAQTPITKEGSNKNFSW